MSVTSYTSVSSMQASSGLRELKKSSEFQPVADGRVTLYR